MNKQTEIPCKDCLLYAVCKQKYTNTLIDTVRSLITTCSLLHKYLLVDAQHTEPNKTNNNGVAYLEYDSFKMGYIADTFEWPHFPKNLRGIFTI